MCWERAHVVLPIAVEHGDRGGRVPAWSFAQRHTLNAPPPHRAQRRGPDRPQFQQPSQALAGCRGPVHDGHVHPGDRLHRQVEPIGGQHHRAALAQPPQQQQDQRVRVGERQQRQHHVGVPEPGPLLGPAQREAHRAAGTDHRVARAGRPHLQRVRPLPPLGQVELEALRRGGNLAFQLRQRQPELGRLGGQSVRAVVQQPAHRRLAQDGRVLLGRPVVVQQHHGGVHVQQGQQRHHVAQGVAAQQCHPVTGCEPVVPQVFREDPTSRAQSVEGGHAGLADQADPGHCRARRRS